MQVAAASWERVLQRGGGNWKLTIEYGGAPLRDRNFFAQELMVAQGGNPERITHSCILFNTDPILDGDMLGYFADPTPRDNSEYLNYTAHSVNVADGWLNTGSVFSAPAGDAVRRVDLLQVAMHEIGHALGLDYDYSGFKRDVPGSVGSVEVKPRRPVAGFTYHIGNGPHIEGPSVLPLMFTTPTVGGRQLISGADVLLAAQLSSFDNPGVTEPSRNVNGHNAGVATTTVSSSSTRNVTRPTSTTGRW